MRASARKLVRILIVRSKGRWVALAASGTLMLLVSSSAKAQQTPRAIDLRVSLPAPEPGWRVFEPSTMPRLSASQGAGDPGTERIFSGALSSMVLAGTTLPDNDQAARWQGGMLSDDSIRRAMRLSDEGARDAVAAASDGMLIALTLFPIVVDALIVQWIAEDNPERMGEMLLVNMQAHAVAQGLTALLKHAVARERPVSRDCRENGGCDEQAAPESFFSGHASLAFTSAALICHYHTQESIFGGAGDATMCATGMALATGVGLMRVLADRHYASDVLIGAGVGVLTGFLVPRFLNFGIGDARTGTRAAVGPIIDGEQYGVQVFGTF